MIKNKTLVEIGCGVGNAILPLLEQGLEEMKQHQHLHPVSVVVNDSSTEGSGAPSSSPSQELEWSVIYALDISPVAIDLLRHEKRFLQFNQRARTLYQSSSSSTTTTIPGSMEGTITTDTTATTTKMTAATTSTNTAITIILPQARAMVCDISKPLSSSSSSLSSGDTGATVNKNTDNDHDHDHDQYGWQEDSAILPPFCRGVAHVTTLLFCLSAIAPPLHMQQTCCNVASTLRPGGVLVVRDYGRYDQAQLKLARSNKICNVGAVVGHHDRDHHDHERDHDQPLPLLCLSTPDYRKHWYRKQDGTCCYYFTTDDLDSIVSHWCWIDCFGMSLYTSSLSQSGHR
jgi:SAM-dependent methyltransferase